MSSRLNLNTVALEYPEEIRNHPVPIILFWGDPKTTEALFGTGHYILDSNHAMILSHKDSNYGYARKAPREIADTQRADQGVLRANWFYKHGKEVPSGITLHPLTSLSFIIIVVSCCLCHSWARFVS